MRLCSADIIPVHTSRCAVQDDTASSVLRETLEHLGRSLSIRNTFALCFPWKPAWISGLQVERNRVFLIMKCFPFAYILVGRPKEPAAGAASNLLPMYCAPSWPLPCTSWFVWLRTSMHISTAHVLQRSNVSAIPAEVVSRRPVCAGNGLTSSAQVDFPRVCFFTTASERHFVFPVGHGVFVPICPYWTWCPSLEPSAGAA